MGCDIHMYAEIKGFDGKWEKVGNVFQSSWDDGSKTDEPYDDRNYCLFAILAGVRNGNGREVTPIAEPKGLPDDMSDKLNNESKDWLEYDGHSFSWFTLKELLDFDWDKKGTQSGVISLEQYQDFKKGIGPNSWCQSIYGGGNVTVSNDELDALIENNSFEHGKKYNTRVQWDVSYKDMGAYFYTKTIPALQSIAPDGDPEKVRIVFWFDN